MNQSKYDGIDKALQEGLSLKVFSPGGGLRVARLELDVEKEVGLRGYGEHYLLSPALERASDDFITGIRAPKPTHSRLHEEAEGYLDLWILEGNYLFGSGEYGDIRLYMKSWNETPIITVKKPTFEEAYEILKEVKMSHELKKILNTKRKF